MTEIIIPPQAAGSAWVEEWTTAFAAAIPSDFKVASVTGNLLHRNQLRLDVRHEDHETLCQMNADRTSSPAFRAECYHSWYAMPDQQALFADAATRSAEEIMIERAGAVLAATRMEGREFKAAVRNFVSGSTAIVRKNHPQITIGRGAQMIMSGLTLQPRADRTPAVRLRCRGFRFTDVTFTPRVAIKLPLSMLQGVTGRLLEDVIDVPALASSDLVIAKAWDSSDQHSTRTCFEVESDRIPLSEATTAIDLRRATMPWVIAAEETEETGEAKAVDD